MKRQQILDAIATRFAAILTAGGYATNIGQKVYPWRLTPLDTASLPCVEIRDTVASVESVVVSHYDHTLTVTAEAFFKNDTPAAEARKAIGDIFKAVEVDYTFGGKAIRTEITSHELAMDQAGDIGAAARVEMQITYRSNRGEA